MKCLVRSETLRAIKQVCFFSILGVVHHGNVATVSKQRAFNKFMISKFTEVIFIDEATESTLDIDG